ncbi:MAG: acetoin utilization protein AcuC, partial [Kocuria sp.]|nr:acetoin utilization protein AcuC [Kocuria sp.]
MSPATNGKGAVYPTSVYWDPQLLKYNFGDYHPMRPSRLDATMRLVQQLGLDTAENVRVEVPEVPDDEVLQLAHTAEYVKSVHAVSEDPTIEIPECGLGTEDTPGYEGIHESSARLVGGSYQG